MHPFQAEIRQSLIRSDQNPDNWIILAFFNLVKIDEKIREMNVE